MARTLAEVARRLNLGHAPLPALILMTDERRLADPLPAAARLPRGAAVILRHYAAADRPALVRELAALCRRRGLLLLVAGDLGLARAVGAQGIHLPGHRLRRGPVCRPGARRPGWLVTAAAHSPADFARARRAGADAVLLSPVFQTASHPGMPALGPLRFALWCRAARLPVYALGGIATGCANRLLGSGAVGIAGIGGLSEIPSKLAETRPGRDD